MKFEIAEKENEEFRPVEIKILVESRQELLELWARFFVSTQTIRDAGIAHEEWNFESEDDFYELFSTLDEMI